MGLPGRTDSSVYQGIEDVLKRHPAITTVRYEPDTIIKQYLSAEVAPNRINPPTGPNAPVIDVEWRFQDETPYYRIHYADSNTGFTCGWHRDNHHPDLGAVHFQYEHPKSGETGYEAAKFSKSVPTEILWIALQRLFEMKIPRYLATE